MNRQVTTNTGTNRTLESLPTKCPHCHRSITPDALFAYIKNKEAQIFFSCPDRECHKTFIGFYHVNPSSLAYNNKTSIGNLFSKEFSSIIKSVSAQFENIFNQSYSAEQMDLVEVCGVGYRKSLEFLIKDYAIRNYPEDKEKIEKQFLSASIEKYVTDARLKSVAKRATWIGNDETHYTRKWEGKDLNDLKKLIDLTVHWIEMEELTKSFVDEMPE